MTNTSTKQKRLNIPSKEEAKQASSNFGDTLWETMREVAQGVAGGYFLFFNGFEYWSLAIGAILLADAVLSIYRSNKIVVEVTNGSK